MTNEISSDLRTHFVRFEEEEPQSDARRSLQEARRFKGVAGKHTPFVLALASCTPQEWGKDFVPKETFARFEPLYWRLAHTGYIFRHPTDPTAPLEDVVVPRLQFKLDRCLQ